MTKYFITTALLLILTASLSAQSPTFYFPAQPMRTDTAANVSIGEYTLEVVYPDVAEFRLYLQDMSVTVKVCNPIDGVWYEQSKDALVSRAGQNIYRAQISPETWIEVNTADGNTYVYQNCVVRPFLWP